MASPTPTRPDYDGPNIAGIVPALLGRHPVSWLPDGAVGATAAVLLVLDGLGWLLLDEHRERAPVLSSMAGGAITTVVPSTTAAALTSITTGTPPADHGLVGYRMRVDGRVLDVLRWQSAGSRAPEPPDVAPLEPFGGKEVPVVTRAEFARTGFTVAHMRGARVVGWRTTATLVEHCRRLVGAGERFVYAYYDGIDRVAHEYGLHDGWVAAEVAAVDRLVGEVLAALPPSAVLVITADHGQAHFGREGWLSLADLAPMIDGYAGDGRFRYLYAARGARRDLHAAALATVGDSAWVFTREQLIDERWLGPASPTPTVAARIGDVVLAAHAPVAFTDPTHLKETGLLAGHGSLTADEMLVPLLASRGRG